MKLLKYGGAGDAQTHATTNHHESADTPPAPFPLECLGETLEAMASAICAAERVTESMAGCCALGIISASLGAGLQVQSGPDRVTRANLYMLVIAMSGVGKSQTFHHAARPFLQYEAEHLNKWKEGTQPGLRADKHILESKMMQIKRSLGQKTPSIDPDDARDRLAKAEADLEILEGKLQPPALACEDVTTEKLAVVLANNGEQVAIVSSDARGVINNILGKYRKDRTTDEDILLKGYSGDPHRVDRIGRASIYLKSPCISAFLMVQPDKLKALFASESLIEGGLLPRFLLCDSHCQVQEIGDETPPIPKEVASRFTELVWSLLETFRSAALPVTIRPTPEAWGVFRDHYNRIVVRLNAGELDDIQSFAIRLTEQAWKISVCLHAAKYGAGAGDKQLDLETAQRAVQIIDWFAAQQLEILSAGRDAAREKMQENVLKLSDKHPEGITARDVGRARIKPHGEPCRVLLAEMEAAEQLVGEDRKPEGGGTATRFFTRPPLV